MAETPAPSSRARSMRRFAAPHIMALALFPLAEHPLAADDIQSWTEVELRVLESDRVAWTIGGVARVRDSLESLYDRRAQTDVDVALSDLVDATFGYIQRGRTRSGHGFGWEHRLRTGLTYPLLRRSVRVEGTTLFEASHRPAGRPCFQPLPPADRDGAPPRTGVPVALPVGGLQTQGIHAVPVEDGCPLEFHLQALANSLWRKSRIRPGPGAIEPVH